MCLNSTHANIFRVGHDQQFVTPNELYQADKNNEITISDGDSIFIENGVYRGNDVLAVWHSHNLYIKGVNGKAEMIAEGAYIWGKGIWVIAGNNAIVENITFTGASVPDQNGAGIRLDGDGITVRHCVFKENEMGILTSNSYKGDVVIEFCEFDRNSFGDGFSHNIYIGHVASFTLRFSYMHHAEIGHNVKSRAEENFILYNKISDELSGNSSMLLDLPNGGYSVIIGNLLIQGENAENSRMITYGAEGLINDESKVYVFNNTLVNNRHKGIGIYIKPGTDTALIYNNVYTGPGDFIDGNSMEKSNKTWLDIDSALFINPQVGNYRPRFNSQLVDSGVELKAVGNAFRPKYEYQHPIDSTLRVDLSYPDIGAYSTKQLTSIPESFSKPEIKVFPNPSNGKIIISNVDKEWGRVNLIIYNIKGELVMKEEVLSARKQFDISGLPSGKYFLVIRKGSLIWYNTTLILH